MSKFFSQNELEEAVGFYSTLAFKISEDNAGLKKELKKAKKKIRKQAKECDRHYELYANSEKELADLLFETSDYQELEDKYKDAVRIANDWKMAAEINEAHDKMLQEQVAELKDERDLFATQSEVHFKKVRELEEVIEHLQAHQRASEEAWKLATSDEVRHVHLSNDEALQVLQDKLSADKPVEQEEESYW